MIKTTGLDGKEYDFKYKNRKKGKRSSHHQEAIDLIRKVGPGLTICEEAPAKIRRGVTLYIDIIIPLIWVAFEIHGKQHYAYSQHFHGSFDNFIKSQRRDEQKEEWCSLNNIDLVVLPYDEKETWERRIRAAITFNA